MPRNDDSSQLTLRGLEPALMQRVRALADEEGISLNKAALRLLRRGAGLGPPRTTPRIGDALDPFIGTWSEQDASELLDSIRSCGQVDPEFWS